MSNPCSTLPGWGSIQFGSAPWSGTVYSSTLLPTYPPFNVFCLGPCGSLLTVTLYPEVTVGPGDQWKYDSALDGLHLWSGATALTEELAVFEVQTGIPDQFSVEWTIQFNALPVDFDTAESRRVHIGAGSHQGYTFGLLFSQIGIAVAPCPDELPIAPTPIPGSAGIIEPGTYVIKVVVSDSATYVYVTSYSQFVLYGHKLRFVLASVVTATECPSFLVDLAWMHVAGVVGEEADLVVSEFCVSDKLLITDFPPIADAGADQAAQFCSIVQLDGTGSKDPEGVGLLYQWRLLDAPPTSGFVLDGLLGETHPLPLPVGYTDKWYSTQLADLVAGDIVPGDTLVVGGDPYTILALGDDSLYGDYIQVTAPIIPDSLPTQAGKVLRQFGISNPTTAKPTFYPDIAGFYKFDLVVFDGAIWSSPSITVVNVVTSMQPRGLVPDMKFIWEYLSDFWKLVDDKGRYAIVWSGLAQFCASELLTLWQYEYNKSLRDIQRTFQRRWLAYPLRYKPRKTVTTLRTLFTPYDSLAFAPSGSFAGTSVTFYAPTGTTYTAKFYHPTGVTTLSAEDVAAQIRQVLPSTFIVSTIDSNSSQTLVRVVATHPFSVIAADAPYFHVASLTSTLGGASGNIVCGETAYKVNMSLSGMGIVENDFLEIDGSLYRIVKLQSSSGGYVEDTIIVKDPLPSTVSEYWSIPCYFRMAEADFWDQLIATGDDAVLDVRGALGGSYYKAYVLATAEYDHTVVAVDLAGLDLFLTSPAFYAIDLFAVYRRHYLPLDELIVDVPFLQETLTDSEEKHVLHRNIDYVIDQYRGHKCIKFDERIWVHEVDGVLVADAYPPTSLWAEVTYLDNRPAIEANFGLPVGFTLEQLAQLDAGVDYLSAVRGLWYSYFNGPRVQLLRQGAQILLGLPFAEEEGTIEEIRTDYSPTTSRLLVRDSLSTQVVRSYTYPQSLGLEINPSTGAMYQVGDKVKQFASLVKGVELVDYVSDQTWIDDYASGGGAPYLQRFFRFLLRVDHGAFNLAALLFVKEFILKVKPTYTYPIFSVLADVSSTSIDVTDEFALSAVFKIFDSPMSDHNMAKMWDQPEDGYASVTKVPMVGPMGSLWKNSYDCSQTGVGVDWGHDTAIPMEASECTMTTAFAGGLPTMDLVFAWDLTVYDPADPGTPITWAYDTVLPAGTYCRDKTL